MEKRILAGKYALIKTKGSNGRISTRLVEDPLGGGRVMVKVFADEDPLALEYIKCMNLLKRPWMPGHADAPRGRHAGRRARLLSRFS